MEVVDNVFGEVISSYSRAEAIEDGVLIDLGLFTYQEVPVLKSVGIRYPVAITSTAFADAVLEPGDIEESNNQVPPRVVHLLRCMKEAIKESKDGDRIRFKVVQYTGVQSSTVELKAICGPGDTAAPVLTIMLTDED